MGLTNTEDRPAEIATFNPSSEFKGLSLQASILILTKHFFYTYFIILFTTHTI